MKPFGDRTAWFVTGSQGLYGDDVLAQVADDARLIAEGLDGAATVPVRVVAKPVVTSPEGIAKLLAEADADPDCLGVIAWMHTFSPAKMWIAGLRALRKPLVHLHTQANRDLPWATIDMDFMNLNQSAHGDREFGYVLTRLRVPRTTVVGHWQDPYVAERLGLWARAAAGAAEARGLRVCRFGDNMRQVAVTDGDKTEVQVRFGVSVDGFGVNDLVAAMRDATQAEVDAVVADCLERYDVVPELRPGGARHASLQEACRIEVGLRHRLEAGGFGAFTDTFEDLGDLPQLPGLPVQRLMADGYGFGGEGDWKTAILVRLLKVMATGLPGGTSFMEDYTYHLGSPRPRILGAHMLEVCPSITAERPTCEIHPLGIGGKPDPVRLVFTARTGPGIVVGLSDMGERLRLVANEVDLVEPDAPLPRLPVARAVWEPRPDLRTSATSWLMAGAPHHTALSIGLPTEVIRDFARMVGVELITIDADTTIRSMEDRLWRISCELVTLTTGAAIAAAVILGGLAVFQLALALGAPYGRFAWGGRYGVLPTPLRVGSLVTMVVYALCAVILLDRAGAIDVFGNDELVGLASWVLVGLFAVGALMNLVSRSPDERRVMTPVALALSLLSLVVALGA